MTKRKLVAKSLTHDVLRYPHPSQSRPCHLKDSTPPRASLKADFSLDNRQECKQTLSDESMETSRRGLAKAAVFILCAIAPPWSLRKSALKMVLGCVILQRYTVFVLVGIRVRPRPGRHVLYIFSGSSHVTLYFSPKARFRRKLCEQLNEQ